jgi:hypothetical protein
MDYNPRGFLASPSRGNVNYGHSSQVIGKCVLFDNIDWPSFLLPTRNGSPMILAKSLRAILAMSTVLALATVLSSANAASPNPEFSPKNFSRSTVINNKWFPLKPGTQFTWNGFAVDEEGDEEAHSHVFTVTDLVKEVAGVRTVVCWDRDFIDKELETAALMFFAQDNDGAVWLLGAYPEEYSDKQFEKQTCWIHGLKDAHAGIQMPMEPKRGMSWSMGSAPAVEYDVRATVSQDGEKTKNRVGSFENLIVVEESKPAPNGALPLKFYARRTGLVHVGFKDKKAEGLDLYELGRLTAEELTKAREGALKLEKHAYEVSKDVYAKTRPLERNSSVQTPEN